MQIPRKFLIAPKVDDAELNLLFHHYQLNWLLLTFYCAASCLFFLLPPRIKFGDKRLWWKNDSFSVAKKKKKRGKKFYARGAKKKRKAFWKDCGKSAGKRKNIKLNYFLFPPRTIEIESRRDWYILEVFFWISDVWMSRRSCRGKFSKLKCEGARYSMPARLCVWVKIGNARGANFWWIFKIRFEWTWWKPEKKTFEIAIYRRRFPSCPFTALQSVHCCSLPLPLTSTFQQWNLWQNGHKMVKCSKATVVGCFFGAAHKARDGNVQ